ncbi:MAG: YdeI/OmpD-associated family protein [Candidatus Andersenbacteria bacterium]|nr:YdeI/OmpD-associated family protein [Candidatus Andersenbacteria bacterium]MBI3250845.1 YdeI/OmpD-associated family protein [Candidatus Andersenbacteria bacterium]
MANKKISTGTVHTLPADLRKALTSDPKARTAWEDITPLARNEWICWTISVKNPETRKNHVERTITELREGMRRPCCWYGCIHRTDKSISPSVQSVVLRKLRKSK